MILRGRCVERMRWRRRSGHRRATTMLAQPSRVGRFGQPDLSPDGRWLLTGLIADDGSVRLFAARADGRPGEPRSIPLLGPCAKLAGLDHQLPSVRVQP